MSTDVFVIEKLAGVTLFDEQRQFLDALPTLGDPPRACLYYKTGAGKTLTALAGMKVLGQKQVLVVAPPSTHAQWESLGLRLGMDLTAMSHAKFRMKQTLLSRTEAVIVDEFHMLGGQQGQGWRKLDKLAMHLRAPLFILSATPNYNDAERCYCVQHVLDPHSCKGGYLQFLYQNCETEQNPFGMVPKVVGFRHHASAVEYLASLPKVFHVPDDLVIDIEDLEYKEETPIELSTLGYDRRNHRMVASQMEMRHTVRYQGLVAENGMLHPHVWDTVRAVIKTSRTPVLIYCNHATVAEALARSLAAERESYAIVTGATSKSEKDRIIGEFRMGKHQTLVGTATLATGTDGLDRKCDTLLILDDTDDASLRRQLIGRITPRGASGSVAKKSVVRMVPIPA